MTAVAYATGSANTMSDFVTALFSFATGTAGWTQLDLDTGNGEASMHIGGTLFVQFRWATSSPQTLALYQALGYGHGLAVVDSINAGGTGYSVGDVLTLSGGSPTTDATCLVTEVSGGVVTAVEVLTAGIDYGSTPTDPVSTTVSPPGGTGCTLNCTFRGTVGDTTPGNSCDDSGSSLISASEASLSDSRGLYVIGNGPYVSHHFFSGTNANGDPYLHVVLEHTAGVFRHMGFGHIDKIGDWTGGEYAYGHFQEGTGGATSTLNGTLLDSLYQNTNNSNEYAAATIRMERFIDQDTTGKWGVCWQSSSAGGFLTDRAGNPRQRVIGGFRGGPIAAGFGWIATATGNAFVPMYQIAPMYWDSVSSPSRVAFMGFMPDVRAMNIKAFQAKEVVTIGSEDWMVFPMSRKANAGGTDDTANSGIAYLRP